MDLASDLQLLLDAFPLPGLPNPGVPGEVAG